MSQRQSTPPDIPTRVSAPADPTGHITLPGYKEHKGLSEETVAFDSSIALDGVKVGTASNTGQGGPNRYYFTSREAEARVNEIANLWATANGEKFEVLDAFLSYLASGVAAVKVAKRLFKKTVAKFPTAAGVLVVEKDPLYGFGDQAHRIIGYGMQEYIVLTSLADEVVLAQAKGAEGWRYFVYAAEDLR